MESRFLKFVANKRGKDNTLSTDTSASDFPCQTSSPSEPRSKLINHVVSKISRNRVPEVQDSLLKTVSYDCVAPGSRPVFGDKPQKGNGPIKLQTSRRLSSGELEATEEDHRALEEIRDGAYIVGHKHGRDTSLRSTPSSMISSPAIQHSIFSSPISTYTSSSPSMTSWTPSVGGQSSLRRGSATGPSESCNPQGTLKVIEEDYQLHSPDLDTQVTIGIVESFAQTSAIISALHKAEYNRLVKIYGSEGVDYDRAQIQLQLRQNQLGSRSRSTTPVTLTMESLPPPGCERKSFDSSRGSRTSAQYNSVYSDASSSERVSMASSYMASSVYTTRTSTIEGESPMGGDEIRRMVREMRSTYLRAIETQASMPVKPRSIKKRRGQKSGKSPLVKSAEATSPQIEDRQTWHGNQSAASSETKSSKPRAASTPIVGLGVTAIDETLADEQSQSTPTISNLQRADSTTLGCLVREIHVGNQVTEPLPAPSSNEDESSSLPTSPDEDDEWAQFDIPEFNLVLGTPGQKKPDLPVNTDTIGGQPRTAGGLPSMYCSY